MAFGFNEDKSRVEVPTKTEYDLTKLKVREMTFPVMVNAGATVYKFFDVPENTVAVIPVLWEVVNPNTHTTAYSALVQVYMAYSVPDTQKVIILVNSTSEKLEVWTRVYALYKPED